MFKLFIHVWRPPSPSRPFYCFYMCVWYASLWASECWEYSCRCLHGTEAVATGSGRCCTVGLSIQIVEVLHLAIIGLLRVWIILSSPHRAINCNINTHMINLKRRVYCHVIGDIVMSRKVTKFQTPKFKLTVGNSVYSYIYIWNI